MTDSDQYKRAYEIQKQARHKAERLLEERSLELFEQNQSLEKAFKQLKMQSDQLISQEKLAAVGQLASGLAHEINNPNAFIQSNLSTLKEYLDEISAFIESLPKGIHTASEPQEIEDLLSDAEDIINESLTGSRRIQSIVGGMRYFAEPDHSSEADVDLNLCIEKAIGLVNSEQKHLVPVVFEPQALPIIRGIPILLIQAISNILRNALEASSSGQKVEVQAKQKDKCIQVYVIDHGCGIQPDPLERVFEPFFSTKTSANGFGLSIALHILHQHKGDIQIHSNPNTGTRVRIILPISEA